MIKQSTTASMIQKSSGIILAILTNSNIVFFINISSVEVSYNFFSVTPLSDFLYAEIVKRLQGLFLRRDVSVRQLFASIEPRSDRGYHQTKSLVDFSRLSKNHRFDQKWSLSAHFRSNFRSKFHFRKF